MSPVEQIPFQGLRSLEADELVPVTHALQASDCVLDDKTVRGRNGYKNALSGAAGTGQVQGLWRFRPSPTSARAVVAQGGHVLSLEDPTAEANSDGVTHDAGTPFGSSANVSAAALGKYLYLASDTVGAAWQRMKSDYTLEAINVLAKLALPTYSLSTLSFVKFTSLAAPSSVGTASVSTINTDYHEWQTGGGVPGWGGLYNFGSDQNWNGYNWLMVVCSPSTQSGGDGHIDISLATSGGAFFSIGTIYDSPGNDSPGVIYCDIRQLDATTKAAARRLQFTNVTNENAFIVHGYLAIPGQIGVGPIQYDVTAFNSTSQQESVLSDDLIVQISTDLIVIPTFHLVCAHYNGWIDLGTKSADPDALTYDQVFNKGAGLAYPSRNDFGAIPTITGTILAADLYPNADTIRLWRNTQTGLRLVTTFPLASALTTTYSMTDNTGDTTLTHQLYKAGGPPPTTSCLTARDGRLIAGGDPNAPHRLYISSYLPIGKLDTLGSPADPFPQFPPLSLIDSDGWAFDIGPSPSEQILWLGNGDALYIATNEAVYSMTDLTPNSPAFKIFDRGVVGRRAALWVEGALFWLAHDGLYVTMNRTEMPTELSESIRRYYRGTFTPDSTAILGYQDRKLYAICGTRMLRYDFVTETWTSGTLAHTLLAAVVWRDPVGVVQNFWMQESTGKIMRWHTSHANDDGTTIAAWVYGSGYGEQMGFMPGYVLGMGLSRIADFYLDVSGSVTVTAYKDGAGSVSRAKTFGTAGEHQLPFASDLRGFKYRLVFTGANAVQLRRAAWERVPVAARGG